MYARPTFVVEQTARRRPTASTRSAVYHNSGGEGMSAGGGADQAREQDAAGVAAVDGRGDGHGRSVRRDDRMREPHPIEQPFDRVDLAVAAGRVDRPVAMGVGGGVVQAHRADHQPPAPLRSPRVPGKVPHQQVLKLACGHGSADRRKRRDVQAVLAATPPGSALLSRNRRGTRSRRAWLSAMIIWAKEQGWNPTYAEGAGPLTSPAQPGRRWRPAPRPAHAA